MNRRSRKLHRILKILVPTDFSAPSEAALDYATFLAKPFGAAIDVLHVWNLRTEAGKGGRALFFADSVPGLAMEGCLSLKRDCAVSIRGRVEFGELCSTILRVAAADDVDLIVMGLHGTTRLSHVFTGHVARTVARHADCPLIMIRASMTQPTAPETFAVPVGEGPVSLLSGDST